jgi:hypothetical protein
VLNFQSIDIKIKVVMNFYNYNFVISYLVCNILRFYEFCQKTIFLNAYKKELCVFIFIIFIQVYKQRFWDLVFN